MSSLQDYHVALIGSPARPPGTGEGSLFSAAAVKKVRELGFGAVQLNIAWGARPGGEPLNIEDVVPPPGRPESESQRAWRQEIRRRARLCREAGLRPLFHFGAPRVDGTLYQLIVQPGFVEGQNVAPCIREPATVEKCTGLLAALAGECPEIDDVMMYTFDQEAWVCGEFGDCPRCRGIPLHERLPDFVLAMSRQWERLRPQGRLYWEPWELSAGQVYRCVEALSAKGPGRLGLLLHGNIAEVMATHSADPWFRHTARLAAEAGMPVVAETFLGSATEEVEPLQHVAAPRLVYETVRRLQQVHGVVGIKEYFGLDPLGSDLNLEMAGLALRGRSLSLEWALEQLAAPYGRAAERVLAGWESAAKGMCSYPWDLCWKFRHSMNAPPMHGPDAFWFNGHLVDSPSWCSTRRTVFMLTEREGPLHSWLLEDIGLRWTLAAEHFERAIAAYAAAADSAPAERRGDLGLWSKDLGVMAHLARRYGRHARETVLSRTMRRALDGGDPVKNEWIAEMRRLLEEDASSSSHVLTDEAKRSLASDIESFRQDPAAWARSHLLDRESDVLAPPEGP